MKRLVLFLLMISVSAAPLAQTLAVKDSAGSVVGFYAGPGFGGAPSLQYAGLLRVITSSGYATMLNANLGRVVPWGTGLGMAADGGEWLAAIFFTTADCSGPGYARTYADSSNVANGNVPMPGVIFRLEYAPQSLWYVPKGAIPVSAGDLGNPFRSERDADGVCYVNAGPSPQSMMFPAAPNDPGVTGFPNAPFVPPLIIEPVPVSSVFSIFRNSFESSQVSVMRSHLRQRFQVS